MRILLISQFNGCDCAPFSQISWPIPLWYLSPVSASRNHLFQGSRSGCLFRRSTPPLALNGQMRHEMRDGHQDPSLLIRMSIHVTLTSSSNSTVACLQPHKIINCHLCIVIIPVNRLLHLQIIPHLCPYQSTPIPVTNIPSSSCVPKSVRTHELMVTTACSVNIPVSSDLSTESRYRRCHLVNLCEHCNRWEPSLHAWWDDWVEDEESHWRCRGLYIDMRFFDEYCSGEILNAWRLSEVCI